MEHIIFIFAFAGGLVCGLFGLMIKLGQQEGNREDYTIKIGLLKDEIQQLKDKLVYSDSLLEVANDECHRLQGKVMMLSRENEILAADIRDLKTVIRDTQSGLDMLNKAAGF